MIPFATSLFAESVGFGLITASVLAIAAVGFTMQFAVTNLLNLAFVGVMIIAAYVAYLFNEHGVSVWIALLGAMAAGALVSLALNSFIYRPFQRRGAPAVTIVVVSVGMLLILTFGTQAVAGPTNVSYAMSQGATIHIASMVFTVAQMVLIALSVVVMLLVHLLMRYTRLGKAMRATSANRDLARNCGIRTDRVITSTWLISGALCGLAGAAFGINSGSFAATSGNLFLVLLLAAVFLGGPGEPYGAMLGALIIGLATEVSASVIAADYKTVVAAVILLVILTLRPSGLMGARA
jgi:branched-chain amino acid transport system permease protein/neutral amino acid transport system permease protein